MRSRPKYDMNGRLTKNTPLTVMEQHFLTEYIRCGNTIEAAMTLDELPKGKNRSYYSTQGNAILKRPNVQAELERIMKEAKAETLATAEEVMGFFTRVMRGEEKDQFGLDASLADRTKAAMELAKRTIDIENRSAGKADSVVEIKLDWSR